MRPHPVLCATLLLAPLSAAASQTFQDARAFVALRSTHIGALTPMLGPAMIGRQPNGAQLAIRYGFNREEITGGSVNTHAIAGSGIFAIGTGGTWAIHAGVSDADCEGCSPEMMLGIGGETRVFEVGDFLGAGSSLSIGISGDAGYAQLKPDGSALSLGVGAPMALQLSSGNNSGMRIIPFVTPVFGIGQINDCGGGGSCNGTRFVLGGGVALWNPLTSISASVGVNHVFFPDQQPVFGVNVVFGGW